MSLDKPIRTQGEPSYGVTLHYDKDRTKVAARSHVPYVWVNTDQFHVDKSTYRDASPIADEFVEYSTAMMCTINSIDEQIATLTARRNALEAHLNESMMIGAV
ncbi:coil containing protein [Vibrio phage 141O35-1]|nr:coil containing protein [Vibrio phage 141O35-1]CAH9015031.1 coil containing protein [Vibrio phage 141E35-1]